MSVGRPTNIGDIGLWADRSALHEACVLGRVLQVRALIQSGLCVNMMTADSVTPLHEASQRGHTMCARLLLEAGAQVEARNIDGSTPLCDACSAGHLDCAKLLLAHGAKVNLSIFTVSPLHEACLAGSLECVQLLIQAGANLEAHDCHLGTALHVACYGQHHDCAKVLLDAGANVNASKLHEMALHHAARTLSPDLIDLLVSYGGNVYARDNRGRTPRDYISPDTACAQRLLFYECQPLQMMQLCRLAVRHTVGPQRLDRLTELPLPSPVLQYLVSG
uniref:SOCS box domain-containing protein n=2 Tax=Eptatretus burgeri TaxID=7764 RepID=A0A8C4QL46_EPTBU